MRTSHYRPVIEALYLAMWQRQQGANVRDPAPHDASVVRAGL